MPDSIHPLALDCAGRAAERAATFVRRDLNRGAASLQAIASLAPLFGMFASAVSLVNALAFRYHDSGLLCVAGSPSEALVPTVLSLPVAIVACGGFYYLRHRAAGAALEMRAAALELVNTLARPRGR